MGFRRLSILCYSAVGVLLLMLMTLQVAQAQVESYQQSMHGKIKKGDTLIIKDEKFQNDAYDWKTINNKLVSDVITFGLYKDSAYYIDKPFKCELDLKIEYWSQPDQEDPITIDHAKLNIDYDTSRTAPFQGERTYSFLNAYKVKLTVNSISSKELGEDMPAIFMLKGEVIADRQYTSKKEETLTMTAFFRSSEEAIAKNSMMRDASPAAAPAAPLSDIVNVNWNDIVPGQDYDLEWSYVDDESDNGRFITANRATLTDAQLANMFRYNSTRITTDKHNYDITLLHSSKYLLLRVRYVIYVEGFREEHPWVYSVNVAGSATKVVDLTWHQPAINWQFSASYAEGGKKKEVVSYFDGTLRNRQTVTVNNTDKKVVLQESIYDEFGRVSASILPAPVDNSILKYYGNQHLNTTNTGIYTYKDVYNNGTGVCVVKPAPLGTQAGAGLYYSAKNPFLLRKERFMEYIPDAGGYPLAVTAYTNDNTGRVRVQGGVGETMQPNQDETQNHATRYFYGKPMQWELDRLFGPNAGNASHFLKNMVIDPNGQIAVSYVNSSGKPVATALSGGAPDNVLPLASKGLSSIEDVPVLEPASFVFDQQELKLKGTTTYLCAVPDHNASIKYRIDKLIKQYKENSVTICSNCYYELKINVYDDCNNKIDANVTPIKIGSTVSDCNNGGFTENTFTVDLGKAGEYTITFELSLNPDVINAYTEDFIKRNTNLRPEFFYIIAQLRNTNFSGCFSDCHNCETALGTKAEFQTNVKQRLTDNKVDVVKYATDVNSWSSGLYDALLANCKSVQVNCVTDPCDGLRKTLKQDVSPGGQYALFDSYGNPLEKEINVLYWYFRDQFPVKAPGDPMYEQTKIWKIDGTEMSPCDANFTINDLVANWRPGWDTLFLKYHPEYCALKGCETSARFRQWDEKVKALCIKASDIPKYLGGKTYDPADVTWLMAKDPLFALGVQSIYAMQASALANYSKLKTSFNAPELNAKSLSQYVDYMLYCADNTGNTSTATGDFISRWNNCAPVAACRVVDREWAAYAERYFQLKEELYQFYFDGNCGSNACAIGAPPSVLPSRCPTVTDFIVGTDTVTCGPSQQSIRIMYEGAPVTSAVSVTVTYPQSSGRPSDVLNFAVGEEKKNLCIPGNIPLSQVNIGAVNCGSGGSTMRVSNLVVSPTPCSIDYVITRDTIGYPHPAWWFHIKSTKTIAPGTTVVIQFTANGQTETVTTTGPDFDIYRSYQWTVSSTIPTVVVNSTNCYYAGCSPLYKNKISRINKIDYSAPAPNNKDSLITDANQQINQMIIENCENSADAWMRQLGTAVPAAKQATLRQKLIEVCKLGGDVNHMGGASAATPTATAEGYTSFKDAMIGVLGAGSLTVNCNPWILSAPYPYNVKAQTTDVTIGASSPAICTRLGVLQTEYGNLGAGKTFFQYLTGKYGKDMKLTQAELDQLVKSCSNCRYLIAEPITLPVFLDPDPKAKGCITATEFNSAMTALSQEPWNVALNDKDENYERIVATYLNFRWGFALGFADYDAYKQKIATVPAAILCNSPVYTSVTPDPFDCMNGMIDGAVAGGRRRYNEYIDSVKQDFRSQYVNVCAGAKVAANLKAMQQLYHFTLYYYDQAGNLVRTVPPEGVELMSAARTDSLSTTVPPDFTCSYGGPTQNTAIATALTGLSTALDKTAGTSIEMWIKGRSSGFSRVITPAANNAYLITTSVTATYCYVSVYKMSATTNTVDILKSNHAALPISAFPVGNWTHVVVQGNDLVNGDMKVYVNGELMLHDPNAPFDPNEWEISTTATQVNITSDLTDLKQIRAYNRELTGEEVWANSQERCMGIAGGQTALAMWARFNTPANGAPGTVGGPNSNIEVRPIPVAPMHRLATDYAYTSLNQVVSQKTPDAGISNFWYDYLGRMIASQNAKQFNRTNTYSYTKYDPLSRIAEVGEAVSNTGLPTGGFYPGTVYNTVYSGLKNEYATTDYDEPVLPGGITQDNLRNRVSAVTYNFKKADANWVIDQNLYSYDLLGNAKTIWHNGGRSAYARTEYKYDLISGNVNTVLYHPGLDDQFYYGYEYDAENRLVKAMSGINSASADQWSIKDPITDAAYYYYKHGPLVRTELGRGSMQGLDYAYTLQGWLKGLNGNYILPATEMGKDGNPGSPTINFPKDVVGFTLDYYQGDYTAIGTLITGTNPPPSSNPFPLKWSGQSGDIAGQNLYNGNISHSILSSKGINNGTPVGYSYRYDQLNRLRTMRQHTLAAGNTTWGMAQQVPAYAEDITYDASGNILTYNRNGSGATAMDQLQYVYPRDAKGMLSRNRLRYVKDLIPNQVYPGVDIFEQHPGAYVASETGNFTGDNYRYDEIGNLIGDVQEGISGIEWTAFGKISRILKGATTIEYFYDATGNRTIKNVKVGTNVTTTYYERDTKGNVLATYEQKTGDANITWKEQYLYGSSRLGVWKPNMKLAGTATKDALWIAFNNRDYEITNHLGNVLATVSDNKVLTGGVYDATITSAVDYAPFGMQLVGRKLNGSAYRYGFNGQEKSDEIRGEGNSYAAQFWEYDPRIGRRWNVDPVKKPWLSDYTTFSNDPINRIDPSGDDDYFNSKGQLISSTKTKTANIYVQTDKGNILLSQLSLKSAMNRQTVANVVGHYAKQVGIDFQRKEEGDKGKGVVGIADRGKAEALAFSSGMDIFVNTNGLKIDEVLDNFNTLKNVLVHENGHKSDFIKKEPSSYLSHARVYLNQLKDESFNKVPEKMQLGLVASFANHLLNYQAEEGLNGPVDVVGLVEDFNKSNKSGFALTINVSYTATSAYSYSIYKGDKLVAKDKIKKTQTSEE
jgi:RHS repeat-associated protein